MKQNDIIIRGAREHNLQNVDLVLPRDQLIVFTGVSGSGKSSLAFDTLYAEGQRRYIESLSTYARQFLGQMQKPDVDFLAGLSPTISIQQKTAGKNPRSTVGTITEIYDYLRVLYARIGQGHCPQCDRPITAQTREQIIAQILTNPDGVRFLILAPVIRGQKGEYKDLFEDMLRRGFLRARVDGEVVRLTDQLKLDRHIKHHIEIVVDRLKNDAAVRPRLAEAVDQALTLGDGSLIVSFEQGKDAYQDILLSAHYACTKCQISYEPPTPQLFSFNSPSGMCLECDGLGRRYTFAPDKLIPDPSMSFYRGAIPLVGPMRGMGRWRKHIYEGVADTLEIDLKTPWNQLPKAHQDLLLYGAGKKHITFEWKHRGGVWKHGETWEGVIPQLISSFKKTPGGPRRLQLEKYMRVMDCDGCNGRRLNPQARAVRVAGTSLMEACDMSVGEFAEWFHAETGALEKSLGPAQRLIAEEVLKEIRSRVNFLLNVGLHYLSLGRSAPTLSGGEAQRIRLAGQIGSGLVGVLYILDEPSIGLHPRDNDRLLESLQRLRDMGNTVLVVEHDEDTMRAADYIVDFGPGPGVRGGEVVAAGTFRDVVKNRRSLTGQFLSGKKKISSPVQRRSPSEKSLIVHSARHNNLKNIDVEFPLGLFICVTGVSGSGKSSLVNDVLWQGMRRLGRSDKPEAESEDNDSGDDDFFSHSGRCFQITGAQHIDKIIAIDQSPIGRTPRSNPATYIKVFDEIRSLFSLMTEAKLRGYKPGRFSFNKPGGRCEACEGNGSNRLEMDFLADVWVTCRVCEGKRFNRETLQIRFKDKNIHDVLEMDVQEALAHFTNIPKVRNMLQTLHDVGLDYVKLGQPSPTLSGGEAQRIRLARELCKRGTGQTLYILDEPTTGLHFEDIEKLLNVLHGFVENKNTVVVIEHNLEVIKTADWLIDLGPDGGAGGGEIVAIGTPEDIAKSKASFTGEALRKANAQTGKIAPKAKPKKVKSNGRLSEIVVSGAQQHNLKNIDVALPREKMSVFCGPSGSGKSSLAFDTIYAEGQRRYVESLSAYARQFLGQMQKPRVEHVHGLSPAISIEQQNTSKSPRSTVGTVTEIYDYLRVLFARLGHPHCPACNIPIGTQTSDEIIDKILTLPEGTKVFVMAPLQRRGQEKYETLWDDIRRSGFARIRVDGQSHTIDDPPSISHRRKHQIEVIVDRLVVRNRQRGRLADAVEAALELGRGVLHVAQVDDDRDEIQWDVQTFSQHLVCDQCRRSFEPLNPHHFSFNNALGWCPTCEGLGVQKGADLTHVLRDRTLSLRDGAIAMWPDLGQGSPFLPIAEALANHVGFSLDTPFDELQAGHHRALIYGTDDDWIALRANAMRFQYKGLLPALDEASRVSFVYRQKLSHLVGEVACGRCDGSRLRDDAAAYRFVDQTIGDVCGWPLQRTLTFFNELKLKKEQQRVAGDLLREIRNRLQFLVDVGLDYVTLSRSTPTLSGGEAQRIRLASQIGSGLTGVLYVLDEPTIGLHPRDNRRLLKALKHLRDLGNSLVVVEHDREVIDAADFVVDFGPGAGRRGGEITAKGSPKQVGRSASSLTGRFLSNKQSIPIPANRRIAADDPTKIPHLLVRGARHNNLKNIDVAIPLGAFVAVTGVSGSGKSSLVHDILHNTLARKLHRAKTPHGACDEIVGLEQIDKVINVDQSPLGNSPNSNPATYCGVFDLVRKLFTQMPQSRIRGYQPKQFSFNRPGGRCEDCEGNGQKRIEMHFLPDVWVECDVCKGSRYNPETLSVLYKDRSIADVLQMQVGEALELFDNIPKIRRILQTLADVGLDYVALGQSAPTLSGGEAQRVKLAAELSRPNTGRTVYLLDEPTTGLHFDDIRKLLDVLNRLVDLGNTVIVIEHNLDVIKTADWIIDLGPEAGRDGGEIVVQGSPEFIVEQSHNIADKEKGSRTAPFLADALEFGAYSHIARGLPRETPRDADDISLESIGKEAQMPWEADGKQWHTKDRVDHNGKPCRWDGKILAWVEKEIQRRGNFSETNWKQPNVVEIASSKKSQGWFFHAHTRMEWVVRLVFRTAKNSFKTSDLVSQLNIPTLDNTPEVEAYSSDERVRVANRKGPWQEVIITPHSFKEIDTSGFRKFLDDAVAAFQKSIQRMETKPEDLMPWKVLGDKWHLSGKGFPPGRKVKWDRQLLPRLLEIVKSVEPNIEITWTNRVAISLRVPGITRAWSHWRTKDVQGLGCRFLGQKGQFNLSQVEKFGSHPEIVAQKEGEQLQLNFVNDEHVHATELKEILKQHLQGFRRTFGG